MRAIVQAREEGGLFTTLWDFCERVDAQQSNKRVLESLVKCGGLDSTGATRGAMLAALEAAAAAGQKTQADALAGQASIFDLGGSGEEEPQRHHPPVVGPELEKKELLPSRRRCSGST